jgi:uncharacterized protein
MKIVVTGASGLIGSALVPELRGAGHEVVSLVRRAAAKPDELAWNPAAGELDGKRLEGVDAVINLCGENIAGGRWTAVRRERILRSRVEATRTLVTTCAKLARKPAVFLSASAVGFYGDSGDEELTESAAAGVGFLPEVALIWETNAEGAARAGIRTVLLRFGVVLAPHGGALKKMLPLFRTGFGGRLGDGRQWLSWVSLDDAVGAVQHALAVTRCSGPVNVVAPGPVTNAEFTATLARVLDRPAAFPVPAVVLRLLFGRMAQETVLASTRALPGQLRATGYAFQHETLEMALRHFLGN